MVSYTGCIGPSLTCFVVMCTWDQSVTRNRPFWRYIFIYLMFWLKYVTYRLYWTLSNLLYTPLKVWTSHNTLGVTLTPVFLQCSHVHVNQSVTRNRPFWHHIFSYPSEWLPIVLVELCHGIAGGLEAILSFKHPVPPHCSREESTFVPLLFNMWQTSSSAEVL